MTTKRVAREWQAVVEVLRPMFDDFVRFYAEDGGEKFGDWEDIENLPAAKKRELRKAVVLAESRDLDEETYLTLVPMLCVLPGKWPAGSGSFTRRFWYIARSRKALPVRSVQMVDDVARRVFGEKGPVS